MLLKTLRSFIIVAVAASAAHAQSKADSVFARARQLVTSGNGAAGRVLIDSVIAATPPDTPEYGDALYWRAALAATSADAERDYRRIVVEYPLSAHSGDALLQLAQLEAARGDRAPATTHLDRFIVENPQHPERARAGLLLVRLLFEQSEVPRGCSVLRRTLSDVPDSAVETRNQLQYYSPRCAAADATPASQLPLPAAGDTSRHAAAVPPSNLMNSRRRKDFLITPIFARLSELGASAPSTVPTSTILLEEIGRVREPMSALGH